MTRTAATSRGRTSKRRKVLLPLTDRLSAPLDLEAHLPFRIAILSNLLLVDRDPLVRDLSADLGLRELRVLINVGSYMPIRAADIAYQTRMDSFTISRAVNTLRAGGYVSIKPDPDDARVGLLMLTAKGKPLYRKLVDLLETRSQRITAALSAREQAQLMEMLGRLEDRAEAVLADEARSLAEQGGATNAGQKELLRWHKRSHPSGDA